VGLDLHRRIVVTRSLSSGKRFGLGWNDGDRSYRRRCLIELRILAVDDLGDGIHGAEVVKLLGDERSEGPVFLTDAANRMNRYQAARLVRRLARHAWIDKTISPHSLRHSFITAALDTGVPLRDVQEAASHADPRTTMRYDRARQSLDRHATHIVATFVAGAAQ
jgi:integrase